MSNKEYSKKYNLLSHLSSKDRFAKAAARVKAHSVRHNVPCYPSDLGHVAVSLLQAFLVAKFLFFARE